MSTRAWLATDYYEMLGVDPGADSEEITQAFRAFAKNDHPDRTDDAEAAERFKALSAAYGVLGDPRRRARYDELRASPRVEVDLRAGVDVDRRPAPAPVPGPDPDTNRPLSVRALPERRFGRWASIGGISLVVVGVVAAALVVWLATSGSTRTANGSDATGRNLTLGLVALKLIVVGIAFVVLGNRRRRYP